MSRFGMRLLCLLIFAAFAIVVVPELLAGTPFLVRLAAFVPMYAGFVTGLFVLVVEPRRQ